MFSGHEIKVATAVVAPRARAAALLLASPLIELQVSPICL